MQETKKKASKWLIPVLVLVLLVSLAVVLVATRKPPSLDYEVPGDVIVPEDTGEETTVPLATDYIVLSYPNEMKDEVSVAYENLEDGQKITFTTGITGEELELFHFTITVSGDEGYHLGTLQDGEKSLIVSMHVQEFADGNWAPEVYNRLNELQSRVNDIIIQFYDDPRFVPNH